MILFYVRRRGVHNMNETIFKPMSVVNLMKEKGKKLTFKKGEYIFHPGDAAEYVFCVDEGEIFISRMQEDGREMITNYLTREAVFGALAIHSPMPEHTTYAKVKEDSVIYKYDKKQFDQFILTNDEMQKEWMNWLDIERDRHASKMRDLFLYGKQGALQSALIRLGNSFGVEVEDGILIDTQLTNQDLAGLCGTSREVVNRMLSDLKNAGTIKVERKYITILDIRELRSNINCERCTINVCQVF